MRLKLLLILTLSIPFASNAQTNGLTKYEINPANSSMPAHFITHDGHLYFTAYDSLGYSLWVTDGNGAPMRKAGFGKRGHNYCQPVIGSNDTLYVLLGGSSLAKAGLYSYDLINDTAYIIAENTYSTNVPSLLYTHNNKIYFHTRGNIVQRYDITTGILDTFLTIANGGAYKIIYANSNYYVSAIVNNKADIFIADTINKTLSAPLVAQSNNSLNPLTMQHVAGALYFITNTSQFGYELYKHTGTGPAQMVVDLWPGASSGFSYHRDHIGEFNNKLYFFGSDSTNLASLFEYNPTNGITQLVYRSPYPPYYLDPKDFYVYRNKLYMSCLDSVSLHQLFRYDGNKHPELIASIQPPIVINPHISESPKRFIEFKGYLYFAANDSLQNIELFRYYDSSVSIENTRTYMPATVYPNPTTGDTYLDIQIKEAQSLALQVLDINGRIVYTLDSKLYSQGKHTICLPLANIPAGTYLYRIANKNNGLLYSGKLIKQ